MLHFVKSFTCAICLFYIISYIELQAENVEEIQSQYVRYMVECIQQFPITEKELDMLRFKKMVDSIAVKCVFACAYKKAGIMDSNGNLSIQNVYAMSENYFAEDKDKLQKAKMFADACQSVNDVDLSKKNNSDCERAALIFHCSIEKSKQFNFIV